MATAQANKADQALEKSENADIMAMGKKKGTGRVLEKMKEKLSSFMEKADKTSHTYYFGEWMTGATCATRSSSMLGSAANRQRGHRVP